MQIPQFEDGAYWTSLQIPQFDHPVVFAHHRQSAEAYEFLLAAALLVQTERIFVVAATEGADDADTGSFLYSHHCLPCV